MSDAPPFDTSPVVCSPDDHSQSDILLEGSDLAHPQQLPIPPYSVTPQTGHMNENRDPRELLFKYHGVPFPAILDGPLRNGLSRIDTKAIGAPPAQLSVDSRLQVLTPPEISVSPPGSISYPACPPMNSKGLSPIPSPMSPNSPAAMGSSDEGSFFQVFDDDDEEDAPQPIEHIVKWKAIRDQAIITTGTAVYIPQTVYQPYTEADRVRYIEKADLKETIIFKTAHPDQWGIALQDALRAKVQNLLDKDDNMFEDCGPSVSIRLQWPGYRAWTKQIPTMDFKSPKGPITRAKLAKNIANCVKRFIEEKEKERMEMEADRRWRVGTRHIRMEDLILVSLHHISKGSWQPQLRLRTPLSEIHLRRTNPVQPSVVY
ncbi:hypothetical protein DEU56DRAFT_917912 [Suillus clintonianus]|uniref:uncharacterized protein n=1 Tax=Suillus clintonianus TaxID=1904413 RepID=UPI001B870C19|nr:uncharacterized protein DEU56DRAFT_917912 [Suillus clintonianus]KAG2122111.1 hypothetical protein DEU56DRAFT_917912 [Suillus clintonianus]